VDIVVRLVPAALRAGLLLTGWLLSAAIAASDPGAPGDRRYFAAGVYEEAGRLVFEGPERAASEPLGEWVVGEPVGRLIGLSRPEKAGATVRALDPGGREAGRVAVPPGRTAVVTDSGVVTVPEALHAPVRAHACEFYALDGQLQRRVTEPLLTLMRWTPSPDGRLLTVNTGPADGERTVIVYDPVGETLWRYTWTGQDLPTVAITADSHRLLLLRDDPFERTTDLTILGPGNEVIRHHTLPLLTDVATSAASQRIAAVGWGGVVLLDAGSGDLVWRREAAMAVLRGGLRFDPRGKRLLVVEGRDVEPGVLGIRLVSLRLRDGAAARAEVGRAPKDRIPRVREIAIGPQGERTVVLHDRVVRVEATQWRRP
jgi:hypothetical protein